MATSPQPRTPWRLVLESGTLDYINKDTREKLIIEPVAANQDENAPPTIPFEAVTLIALISLEGTAPMENLLMRIMFVFPYWSMAAMRGHLYGGFSFDNPVLVNLTKALFCYDLPLVITKADRRASMICTVASTDAALCALRMLLQGGVNLLGSTPSSQTTLPASIQSASSEQLTPSVPTTVNTAGTSSSNVSRSVFMKLPPELRNYIYGLVLIYPLSGINFGPEQTYGNPKAVKHILTKTRDHDTVIPFSSWVRRPGQHLNYGREPEEVPVLRSHRFSVAMALTRINREIGEESSGIFYGHNHFHFTNLKELATYLEAIGSHSQHIRKVSLTYETRWRGSGTSAFRELAKLNKIDHLAMKIKESDLKKYKGWNEAKDFKGLTKLYQHLMKSFPDLKTFKLEDYCEGVFRYLKPALEARKDYHKLDFTYQGQEVCKKPSCDIDDCAKYHGQ